MLMRSKGTSEILGGLGDRGAEEREPELCVVDLLDVDIGTGCPPVEFSQELGDGEAGVVLAVLELVEVHVVWLPAFGREQVSPG